MKPSQFALKGFLKGAVILLALSGLLFWIARQTQFLECVSNSLTGIRYLIVVKDVSFKRGDIVSIKNHDVAHVQEQDFAKRILGLPGDKILREGNTIHIGNAILTLLKETKERHPLTSLTVKVVPERFVFVAGDHPRSFDSRYEEFGLVPIAKIWGRAIWQYQ